MKKIQFHEQPFNNGTQRWAYYVRAVDTAGKVTRWVAKEFVRLDEKVEDKVRHMRVVQTQHTAESLAKFFRHEVSAKAVRCWTPKFNDIMLMKRRQPDPMTGMPERWYTLEPYLYTGEFKRFTNNFGGVSDERFDHSILVESLPALRRVPNFCIHACIRRPTVTLLGSIRMSRYDCCFLNRLIIQG